MENKFEVIGKDWYTDASGRPIGMVAIKTHGGWKAYIGVATGNDEDDDAQTIAANGAKLSKSIATAAFDKFNPDDYNG